jgi:hypothetical protein
MAERLKDQNFAIFEEENIGQTTSTLKFHL